MNKFLFNAFVSTKVPIARIAGLRLHYIDAHRAQIAVRHGWLNQNPFKSMFWAVEGMAAEFSTGILCIEKIRKSAQNIAMLMVNLEGSFAKKATGMIIFTCEQGAEIDIALLNAITTKDGQTIRLRSTGVNKQGEQVAEFIFTWSFKLRS